MDSEDRDKDKSILLFPENGSNLPISLDVIKTVFIAEGLSIQEIAKRFNVSEQMISGYISKNKLDDLRAAYVREGLMQIQSVQIDNAQKIMDIETNFKKLRIKQLEAVLSDYAAYYARHGHLYKIHPVTGEILKDTSGIPMQLRLPNVGNEIRDLKESVSLSEGLKNVLNQIDSIINNNGHPRDVEPIGEDNALDVGFQDLFKRTKKDD